MTSYQDIKLQTDFSSVPEISYDLPTSDSAFIKTCSAERIQNLQNAVKTNGQRIRFQIPSSDKFLDPKSLFLSLKIKSAVANRAPSIISNLISEMTIRDGYGTVIERVENYAEVCTMIRTKLSDDFKTSTLGAEGLGTQSAQDLALYSAAGDAATGLTLVHKPIGSGILSRSNQWIPLALSRGLQIELKLRTDVFSQDTANQNAIVANDNVSVLDSFVTFKSYEINDDVYAKLEKQFSDDGLSISFEAMHSVARDLQGSTSIQQLYNENLVSVNSLNVFAMDQNSLTFQDVARATDFLVKIGKMRYPEYGLDGNLTESELFYLSKLESHMLPQQVISETKWGDFKTSPVLEIALEKYGQFSGQDLVDKEIQLTLKGLANSARTLYIVFSHETIVHLKSGSSTEVLI